MQIVALTVPRFRLTGRDLCRTLEYLLRASPTTSTLAPVTPLGTPEGTPPRSVPSARRGGGGEALRKTLRVRPKLSRFGLTRHGSVAN